MPTSASTSVTSRCSCLLYVRYAIINLFHFSFSYDDALAYPYPGQSTNCILSSGPKSRKCKCYVFPGVLEHITIFLPNIPFIRELFPTLLRPTKANSLYVFK